LFASANTVPGVTDFRLFFRSQVPRERWAFLLARRAWRESEIDHLYPHAILDSDPAAKPSTSSRKLEQTTGIRPRLFREQRLFADLEADAARRSSHGS